jgi:hypothetical protein
VITLQGNSFPSRVASSLLSSFDDSPTTDLLSKLLVTYSKKSYEDLVIRLLRSPSLLHQLREILTQHNSHPSTELDDIDSLGNRVKRKFSGPSGLFDTDRLVHDFLSAMFGLREVQHLRRGRNGSNNCTNPHQKHERKFPHLIVVREEKLREG